MSAQEAQSEIGASVPAVDNAQAQADADAVLAELNAEEEGNSKKQDEKHAESDEKEVEEKDSNQTAAEKEEDGRDGNDSRRENGYHPRRGNATRGRGGSHRQDSRNIKSNLIIEEKSDDPVAIRKQVEFYFSDANLPRDQFLLGKVYGSENRPVELDIIRSFKRMRHFEPLEAIVSALKESKTLRLVDNDTKVQRVHPLPQSIDDYVQGKTKSLDAIRVFEDKAMPRSVYVKGFGEEVPSTQFDIEAFFAPYGPTNAIRLRRAEDKSFKGSVFAEFETEELAQAFVALDPKPKFKDRDLKIMMKKVYCDGKAEDIRAGRIQPSENRPQKFRGRGGKFNDRNDRRRDRDDDRDWRTRREEDKKNGFRDKRTHGRDDRERRTRRPSAKEIEKDEKGVPVVKTSEDQRADAIAQAKAAVEADKKKEGEENGEETSKKREREDDATEEPAAKKVDVKADA